MRVSDTRLVIKTAVGRKAKAWSADGTADRNGVTTDSEFEPMRRSNFALRLQPSLLEELRKAAEVEGVALNQLINVAVAEKVSALRTEEYFRERGRRADRAKTLRILERAGKDNPPMKGDELVPERQKKAGRKAANGRAATSKHGQRKRSAATNGG
jgi:HicB family